MWLSRPPADGFLLKNSCDFAAKTLAAHELSLLDTFPLALISRGSRVLHWIAFLCPRD